MSADIAVGIMDGAYFTSRSELLNFFNTLLDLNLTKIEQTASGAVACQLTEYIFPGSIPMSRINWDTKNSYEYVQNYKILQAAFSKNRVQKYVDVDKLIRGKYQDNLEFCQWLKAFHDQQRIHGSIRDDYNPLAARSKGKGAKRMKENLGRGTKPLRSSSRYTRTQSATKTTARRRTPEPVSTDKSHSNVPPKTLTKTRTINKYMKRTNLPSQQKSKSKNENSFAVLTPVLNIPDSPNSIIADASLIKKNTELTSRNAELELTVAGIEKERDFYFEKLRDVEVLLQVHEEQKENIQDSKSLDYDGLLKRVFHVLYATTEDKVIVDDDGKVTNTNNGSPQNLTYVTNVDANLNMECHMPSHLLPITSDEIMVDEQEMY